MILFTKKMGISHRKMGRLRALAFDGAPASKVLALICLKGICGLKKYFVTMLIFKAVVSHYSCNYFYHL